MPQVAPPFVLLKRPTAVPACIVAGLLGSIANERTSPPSGPLLLHMLRLCELFPLGADNSDAAIVERNAVLSPGRLRVESFPWPLAGNDGHAAAESIDFNSSVFFQLMLLSAGRTLTPRSEASNERARKDCGKIPERLGKAAGLE